MSKEMEAGYGLEVDGNVWGSSDPSVILELAKRENAREFFWVGRDGVKTYIPVGSPTPTWDTKPAGVGDVTSDAKGSGARFNAGKAPMHLIPVWVLASALAPGMKDASPEAKQAHEVLTALGCWQRGLFDIYHVMHLASPQGFEDCARVFEYGAKKYAEWNWAKGMKWSVPTACAVRHLLAMIAGFQVDPESMLPHRGHVLCNLVMLAQYEDTYPEGDDRPAFLKGTVS